MATTSLNINVDRSKNEALNLLVLKRRDSNIMEIVSTASHVVIYAFDHDKQEWNRAEVEGTLFIVKRCIAPRFQLCVKNRLSTENFTVSLSSESHVDIQDTFLILRRLDKDEIYGVWFYPEEDREPIYKMTKKAIRALNLENKPPTPTAGSAILSMIKLNATNAAQLSHPQIEQKKSATLLLPDQVAATSDGINPNLTTCSISTGTRKIRLESSSESSKRSLLIPSNLTTVLNPAVVPLAPSSSSIVDKELLRQTLIELLRNDSEFFNQIHTAYVQQVKKQ